MKMKNICSFCFKFNENCSLLYCNHLICDFCSRENDIKENCPYFCDLENKNSNFQNNITNQILFFQYTLSKITNILLYKIQNIEIKNKEYFDKNIVYNENINIKNELDKIIIFSEEILKRIDINKKKFSNQNNLKNSPSQKSYKHLINNKIQHCTSFYKNSYENQLIKKNKKTNNLSENNLQLSQIEKFKKLSINKIEKENINVERSILSNNNEKRYEEIINFNKRNLKKKQRKNSLDVNHDKTDSLNQNSIIKLNYFQEKNRIKEIIDKNYEGNLNNYKKNSEKCIYIINSKWWRSWTDYVNFNSENNDSSFDEDSKLLIRPNSINNYDLINNIESNNIELKPNLLEYYDYECIPKKIYKLLKLWYNVDHEIIRFFKKDPMQNNKIFLDLYPEKIEIHKEKFIKNIIKRKLKTNNIVTSSLDYKFFEKKKKYEEKLETTNNTNKCQIQ